ncbi:MAG TPA: carboxypeptidase M32 [Solirubrobacteraceae bacterium]|nr:carboxypeptidase M32 [Solirubrobacteraceae bacterium]
MSAAPDTHTALRELRERLAEIADLTAVEMLSQWDQLVMMPAQGGQARAHQLATLASMSHERATAEQIGACLERLEGGHLDEIDGDIVRVARRDWERARRVPGELASEIARASAEGQEVWQRARANDEFAMFAPALEHNVALARERGACLAEPGQGRYEALLGDYDYGLKLEDLRRVLGGLARELPPLIADAEDRCPHRSLAVPVDAQQTAVQGIMRRLGVERSSWRVDVSTHPFTTWIGRGDSRITTRYGDGDVESLLSSLHEYGHALYERQIDPTLDRTNLGTGTSMSIHESQSKLWENHVARSAAFAQVMARELSDGGFATSAEDLHATLVGVKRTPIRVSADPLTYPLHIVARFELELALIEGELEVSDLPAAWREAIKRLLGIEIGSDAQGCLQDVHWSAGAFGYFPSYALGCLIAAQLWQALERELGPRDDDLREGRVEPIQRWLGEHVHRYGRRVDTMPLVERATGKPLEIEAFLRYAAPPAGE